MQSLRFSKPLPNKVNLRLRRSDTPLGLLLKLVQNVHGLFKPNGVDGTPRAAALFRYDLQNGGAAKSAQRLRGRIRFALLRRIERCADFTFHRLRK